MMNFKTVLSAAALTVAMPLAASAASVTIMDTNIDEQGGYFADANLIEVSDIGDFGFVADFFLSAFEDDRGEIDINEDDAPFQLEFTFNNTSGSTAVISLVNGAVTQALPTYGFSGGVDVWFGGDGGADVVFSGDTNDFDFGDEFTLADGESRTLLLTFGSPIAISGEIDFDVYAAPVPVPAAGFLLLGGLGGLAMMRRRKKS